MIDETEELRKQRIKELSATAGPRAELEARYGPVWDTEELARDFTVLGFMAPLVVVIRKVDGQKGSLEFQGMPRFYFNFVPHKP
jgi:hypothetical protein